MLDIYILFFVFGCVSPAGLTSSSSGGAGGNGLLSGIGGGLSSSSYPSNLAASLNLAGVSLPSPLTHPLMTASSSSLITGLDLSTHNLHNAMGMTDPLLSQYDPTNIIAGGTQPLNRGSGGPSGLLGATTSLPNLGIVNSIGSNLTPGSSGLLSGLSLPSGASNFLSGLTNSLTNPGFPNVNHLPTIITTNFDKDGRGLQHLISPNLLAIC